MINALPSTNFFFKRDFYIQVLQKRFYSNSSFLKFPFINQSVFIDLSTLLFLFLCYLLMPSTWIIYAFAGFFIPQISFNAYKGHRFKSSFKFIILLGFLRAAIPVKKINHVKSCNLKNDNSVC